VIRITADGLVIGRPVAPLGYVRPRASLGRVALRFTRWRRAVAASRHLAPCDAHLDIGCGDGYFLRRSPARERVGLDKLLGDEVTTRLDFPDASFDVVSMLAVIEHLPDPRTVLAEIHRVLRPGGRLVLTTPRRAAELLIRLYVVDIEDEHETYFDRATLARCAEGLFDVVSSGTFLLGLNQVFCLRKRA
jgi:SAM-dependent methyltransferase